VPVAVVVAMSCCASKPRTARARQQELPPAAAAAPTPLPAPQQQGPAPHEWWKEERVSPARDELPAAAGQPQPKPQPQLPLPRALPPQPQSQLVGGAVSPGSRRPLAGAAVEQPLPVAPPTAVAAAAAAKGSCSVIVNVMSARGLQAMDTFNGKADPFVVLRCNGEMHKTSVIKANLNPDWSDRPFLFHEVPSTQMLVAEVYDWNLTGASEPMGMSTLTLDAMSGGGPLTLDLQPLQGSLAQGTLTLACTCHWIMSVVPTASSQPQAGAGVAVAAAAAAEETAPMEMEEAEQDPQAEMHELIFRAASLRSEERWSDAVKFYRGAIEHGKRIGAETSLIAGLYSAKGACHEALEQWRCAIACAYPPLPPPPRPSPPTLPRPSASPFVILALLPRASPWSSVSVLVAELRSCRRAADALQTDAGSWSST
jgi:hypothetical protein